MSGGLFLVGMLAAGLIVLTIVAARHIDRIEQADADSHHDLLQELRRHD